MPTRAPKHAYDENGNAWADLTAGGSLTTRRLYADAVDALMARIGSSNDEDWYLTDLLGSVRDIADSTGAGIDHLDYNTFGGVATETSPSNGDRYAWTGRDVETGLQYNRARYGRHEQVPAERNLHLEPPQRLPHA